MPHYRQTQFAWPIVAPLAVVAAIVGNAFLRSRLDTGLVIFIIITALAFLLFSTFTVTIDDTTLKAKFGHGLFGTTVRLDQIRSYRAVRNRWYYGWGMHYFPGGKLYNASGLLAVELRLANGRYVRIGTAAPDAVMAALQQVVGPSPSPADESRPTWGTLQMLGALLGLAAAALAAWVFYAGLQPPAVTVAADGFSVRNGLSRDTIALRFITSAELDESLPRVERKVSGFAVGETLRGTFRLDTWGNARLYVNVDHPPFVVVRSPAGVLAVNFKDPERTRELYEELRRQLGSRAK
jgi:hypothetical protein